MLKAVQYLAAEETIESIVAKVKLQISR